MSTFNVELGEKVLTQRFAMPAKKLPEHSFSILVAFPIGVGRQSRSASSYPRLITTFGFLCAALRSFDQLSTRCFLKRLIGKLL